MNETVTRKEQIVEIASKLFFEQGYHVTGIKQIIEAADMAKGTFYSHFKSKEELGLEWLSKGNAKWIACRNQFLEQFGDDPEAKLIGLFDFLSASSEACNFRGCAFLNMLAESPDISCPMRKAIREYKRGYMEFIRSLVEQRLPNASAEDIEYRTGAIYLLSEGAVVATQSFCRTGPIDIAKKQVSAILSQ